MSRYFGQFFARLLAVALIVALGCVAGEVVTHWLRPQVPYSRLRFLAGEEYIPGTVTPFTLKPNFRGHMPSMEHPGTAVELTINSHGMRGPEFTTQKPAGVKRVLVLGDSYTFGLFCAESETYPAALQRLYTDEGQSVEVLNAGYADGWGPDEHYAWLMHDGFAFDPDVVVYGFFVGNDIEDIYRAGWQNLDEAGLPRAVVNPTVEVDDMGAIRSRIGDWKNAGSEWFYRVPILRESQFFILTGRVIERLRGGAPKTPNGGTLPFPMILGTQTPPELQPNEEAFFRLVAGMAQASEAHHARFAMMMIPVNFQVEAHFLPMVVGGNTLAVRRNFFEDIKPRLDGLGIQHVDLLAAMKSYPDRHFFPRIGEVHMNPEGNAFAAATLKSFLDAHGALR